MNEDKLNKRKEPEPQHTYRLCHCGRRLRAGELCAESYDGHKPRSEQRMLNAEVRRLRERRTAHSLKRQKAEQDAAELRREVKGLRRHIARMIQAGEDMYDDYPWGNQYPTRVYEYAEKHGLLDA